MAGLLDKGTASKLKNSLQASPGASAELQKSFAKLLDELQNKAVSETQAEKRLKAWIKSAPGFIVTILRTAVQGEALQKNLSTSSWLYRVFTTAELAEDKKVAGQVQ